MTKLEELKKEMDDAWDASCVALLASWDARDAARAAIAAYEAKLEMEKKNGESLL